MSRVDVGGGGWSGGVGVSDVGAGGAEAEVAPNPSQCGVPRPVGRDALRGDPRHYVESDLSSWRTTALPDAGRAVVHRSRVKEASGATFKIRALPSTESA